MPSSYARLAESLGMSASETHAAIRRLQEARLLDPDTKALRRDLFMNFLIHGVPYAFPAHPAEITRGMPTAWAAPVLKSKLAVNDNTPPVWPDPEGNTRGAAVTPLYSSVPFAAATDSKLYDLLALVDCLRIGRARERAEAIKELTHRLNPHAIT
jgi:DNA-binding Lrp family transcriptional regulator